MVTLGTKSDEQMIDGLMPKYDKNSSCTTTSRRPYSTNGKAYHGKPPEIDTATFAERSFYPLYRMKMSSHTIRTRFGRAHVQRFIINGDHLSFRVHSYV